MICKLLGAGMVFLGCSAIGFLSAGELGRERDQLRAFLSSLALMRFEIGYRAHTLAEIFATASESAPKPLSDFFRTLASLVSDAPEEPLSEHIEASLRSASGTIPQAIRTALQSLGTSLGGSDTEAQLHILSLCEEQVSAAERALQKEFTQRCRVYRTLGICVGALIVILFM